MSFYDDWSRDKGNKEYMLAYLSKAGPSREALRNGTGAEVKNACALLRSIPMESFIGSIKELPHDRLPETDEIPQCGTLEKAICEVPQALAFAPDGLKCAELGLRLGASSGGDAPRKSGEGNGKLADAMDIAVRMKLPADSKSGIKYGYKISSLGRYLLRFSDINDKMDIIARLLTREYVAQVLIVRAMDGYASYEEVVSSLRSPVTRMRRRQNVRRVMSFIDSQTADWSFCDEIDWEIRG